jgi:hypothetical protein
MWMSPPGNGRCANSWQDEGARNHCFRLLSITERLTSGSREPRPL